MGKACAYENVVCSAFSIRPRLECRVVCINLYTAVCLRPKNAEVEAADLATSAHALSPTVSDHLLTHRFQAQSTEYRNVKRL